MPVVRNTRVAERTDEHRVACAQRVVTAGRDRDAGLQVVIRAPRQLHQVHSADNAQHLHRRGDDLLADPVAGNNRDPVHGRAAPKAELLII